MSRCALPIYARMAIDTFPSAHTRLTSGADRRREQRVRFSRMIEISPCDQSQGEDFLLVELYDCSEHGLAFYLDRELSSRTEFLLRIQLSETQIVLYTVRNCIKLAGQKHPFRIGAEFTGYIAASSDTTRSSIVEAIRALPE